MLELASSPVQTYRLGDSGSRRELAIRLCSNRSVAGRNISVEPVKPFSILTKRKYVIGGAHSQYRARTVEELAAELWKWAKVKLQADRAGQIDRGESAARLSRLDEMNALELNS